MKLCCQAIFSAISASNAILGIQLGSLGSFSSRGTSGARLQTIADLLVVGSGLVSPARADLIAYLKEYDCCYDFTMAMCLKSGHCGPCMSSRPLQQQHASDAKCYYTHLPGRNNGIILSTISASRTRFSTQRFVFFTAAAANIGRTSSPQARRSVLRLQR